MTEEFSNSIDPSQIFLPSSKEARKSAYFRTDTHLKNSRPPIPYSVLIAEALKTNLNHTMALQEIYEWFEEFHPFYCDNNHNWRNSVRHTLSSSKLFKRIPKYNSTSSRGSLWTLNEQHSSKGLNKKLKISAHSIPQSKTHESSTFNQTRNTLFEWCFNRTQDKYFHSTVNEEVNWSQPRFPSSKFQQSREDNFQSIPSPISPNNILDIDLSDELLLKSIEQDPHLFDCFQADSAPTFTKMNEDEFIENLFPFSYNPQV
jgi:hypothetical protein